MLCRNVHFNDTGPWKEEQKRAEQSTQKSYKVPVLKSDSLAPSRTILFLTCVCVCVYLATWFSLRSEQMRASSTPRYDKMPFSFSTFCRSSQSVSSVVKLTNARVYMCERVCAPVCWPYHYSICKYQQAAFQSTGFNKSPRLLQKPTKTINAIISGRFCRRNAHAHSDRPTEDAFERILWGNRQAMPHPRGLSWTTNNEASRITFRDGDLYYYHRESGLNVALVCHSGNKMFMVIRSECVCGFGEKCNIVNLHRF